MALERSNATGLIVGRAKDVCSYARNYGDDDNAEISKEWAILSFDSRFHAFLAEGHSGSVIVDGRGHIGGLITSGSGDADNLDIATPVEFSLKRMHPLENSALNK
ncbi:hypothetical protein FRB96_002007 [Tulasnella sp. 330]|nr:hypothetical protein FRB96_002007 [Tulasnella sp. 330]